MIGDKKTGLGITYGGAPYYLSFKGIGTRIELKYDKESSTGEKHFYESAMYLFGKLISETK